MRYRTRIVYFYTCNTLEVVVFICVIISDFPVVFKIRDFAQNNIQLMYKCIKT